MNIIDRMILFKESTSKVDLLGNKNTIVTLDSYSLESKAKFNLDSGHMFYITLDVDLLGNLVNAIPKHGVIKTYAQNEYQYWIIVNIDKNLDTVELTCRHWTTETLLSMFLVDSKPRNLSGLAMLDWLKSNSEEYKQGKQFAKDLELGSNLSDLKSMNAWHDSFYNVVSELQELYQCEINKSGFKVELVDYVGSKTPKYKIEYGKNLISNSAEEDLTIIKGVLAKGYDKLYADNIIYSGKLKDNPNMLGETVEKVYPIRVREEGKEDEDGYTYYNTETEAKVELERLARLEFTKNRIDEPIVTFDTQFLELSTVEEHKDDAKVWLSIGDKIATYIPKFNIDIETRIIEMEVDVLADEITNITLSNNDIKDLKPPTLNSIKKEIQKLPSVEEVLTVAKNESLNTVMSGFGGHARHYPDRSIYMDTDNEKTCRYCMIINYKGYFFSKGGVNPRPEDVTMIADINGNFYADVINAGTLNANLIKAGILKSFNGNSWLNMENGNFDFAKGNLSFDGKNLQMIGKLINILNGFGIEMNQGGLMFANEGEIVGGIRSSRFLSNTAINGFNLVSTRDGDYIDISFTDGENFEGSPDFVPIIRITKSKHELMGNFKGIQLLDDVRVSSDKDLFVENVYRGTTTEGTKFGRYYNNTWCGSIEATAKRISNLNVFYDSGWYAYSNGANGAPSSYGIMLHFKWNTEDFIQIAFDFANTMYQRAWVNGAWTSWKTR
ncbi:MAG: phage tail spike protein [Clostridium sp.]|nr:phage tail spike protein [Clostridium sp.]